MCFPLEPVFTRDKRRLPNFIDEPMNGLDKHGVADIRELLMELKKQGKLILLASHNPADIELLCDEVYEMELGNIRNFS